MGLSKVLFYDCSIKKFEFESEDPVDVLHFFVMDQKVTGDKIVSSFFFLTNSFRSEHPELGSLTFVKMAVTRRG